MNDAPTPRPPTGPPAGPLTGHLVDLQAGRGTGTGPEGPIAEVDRRVADLLARRCDLTDPIALDLVTLLVAAQRHGHSCLDLERIDGLLENLAGDGATPRPPSPPLEELLDSLRGHPTIEQPATDRPDGAPTGDDPVRPLVLRGSRLFSRRNDADEASVAGDLRRLASVPPTVPADLDASPLRSLFPAPEAHDPHSREPAPQHRAVHSFLDGGVTVLTGGPGTGKTYTIARALAALIEASLTDRPPRIAVCAPTGKAAARMGESLAAAATGLEPGLARRLVDVEPTTVHRLLGPRPDTWTRFRHHAGRPLDVDVVVADETSMLSLSLLARLLEAVPTGARLLLVGDPDQLESIESGSVLRDLVDADGTSPTLTGRVVRLVANHRAREGTQLPELAEAIRLGAVETVLELLADGVGITWNPTADPPGRATELLGPVLPSLTGIDWSVADERDLELVSGHLASSTEHRLLCGNRHGPTGASTWNRLVEDALDLRGQWYPGRPLLATRNESRLGLVNGDVGVVVRTPDGPRACFEVRGGLRLLHPSQLPPVDTAYALTIHKSQGSEYTDVTTILPAGGSPLLRRELLYTAITRARRSVTIVGTDEAIRSAVERRGSRMTGLVDALAGT